jgi:hypothetical protein
MKSLGIRAEPNTVHWAIAEGSAAAPILVAIDTAEAPAAYEEGAALSWYRDRIGFVIDQYKPQIMAIRYSEPIGKSRGSDAAHQRSRLEGVILECGDSKNLKIVAGALVTITKNLGSDSAKKYLDQENLRGLDWSKYSKNKREAILAAVSVLPAQ